MIDLVRRHLDAVQVNGRAEFDFNHFHDLVCDGREFVECSGGSIGVVLPVRVAELALDIADAPVVEFPATLEIAYVAGCDTVVVAPLPFVVVWVVDVGFDATCAPAEGGMTLGTPHLVTAFDFEDTGGAFGAGLGVFVEQFGGFEVVGVAGVFGVGVGAFDHMALGTRRLVTQPTFPLGAEEASAVFVGAGTDELFAFLGGAMVVAGV